MFFLVLKKVKYCGRYSEYVKEVRNVMAARYVRVGLPLARANPVLADISGTMRADLAGVLNDIAASTISF